MYNIIVVDDEPSAIRNISMIVEKYCKNFKVIATAENGKDAIEKIKGCRCDAVITDVCMPLMDGIRLLEWINKYEPNIKTIVTSGYQEFEYVQKAINLGACSYLLKPVVPAKMSEVIEKIESDLDKYYMKNQISLFNAFYYNEGYDMKLAEKFFPSDEYYLAVKRNNGLPARYKKNSMLDVFVEHNRSIIICGRDINEELFFIPKEMIAASSGVESLVKSQSSLNENDGYTTLVYFDDPMKISDFSTRVKELYRALDSVITIGVNQILTIEKTRNIIKTQVSSFENDDLDKFYYFIKEKQYSNVKKELDFLFKTWEDKKRTQLYIEAVTKQILYKAREIYGNSVSLLESEYLMEEIFVYSNDIQELRENYLEILERFIKQENFVERIDTPQFLDRITKYLKLHIGEQTPLKEVCREFGVSQPYLSKMFRKYLDESYNQHTTRIKVEKAIELITQRDDMKIKDIAAMVGYEDQFYFSRVFRSYTGKAPSEFMHTIKEAGAGKKAL